MEKWAIFIDLEGFGDLYLKHDRDHAKAPRALPLLSGLAGDVFLLGEFVFSKEPERLFIYNFGDGFCISPSWPDETIERPLAIAITLMRLTALRGGLARAAISYGEMSDIQGWLPEWVRARTDKYGSIHAGEGLMVFNPVMGDAIVRAYKLLHQPPKGPRVLVDPKMVPPPLPEGIVTRRREAIEVDWMQSSWQGAEEVYRQIAEKYELPPFSQTEVVQKIREYISDEDVRQDYKELVEEMLPASP